MEDHHSLLRHLLPTTTTTTTTTTSTSSATAVDIASTITNGLADVNFIDEKDDSIKVISSNSKIVVRLLSVAFVGILSIWANHEASKGFEIDIENRAVLDSSAGRRFQVMYVANDKATRLVLNTSKFVETILYPNSISQKQVNRVTLRLAHRNLTHMVTVESLKEGEFVLNLSPSILEETNFEYAMLRAVQQGMARVWLYDDNVPKPLVNGMVEYISRLAGTGMVSDFSGGGNRPESDNSCWMDEDPVAVARFLSYYEQKRRGFIQRLNQAMKGRWQEQTVGDALEMPARHLCGLYISQNHLPLD